MPLPARYPGTCDRCNDPIEVGDRIVLRHRRAMHERCAPGGDD